MSGVDPHVLAEIDQARAVLRDLTDDARRHHAKGCDAPDVCVGLTALRRMDRHYEQMAQILALAVAERAQRTADDV